MCLPPAGLTTLPLFMAAVEAAPQNDRAMQENHVTLQAVSRCGEESTCWLTGTHTFTNPLHHPQMQDPHSP